MPSLPTTGEPPNYHWSPANQRTFLEHLAISGNISESAKAVAMSWQAAYAFRARSCGRVFKLGWDAAILLARTRLEGELLERALEGQEEIYERDADTGKVRRTRIHNGLSMAMLSRLDRMSRGRDDTPADTAMALVVSQDFEHYLDLVEANGGGAEAMLFLKARDGGMVPMVNMSCAEFANHYQLSQNPAVSVPQEDTEKRPPTPEEEAAEMHVWFSEHAQEYRTNFPPPVNFRGIEDGEFGISGYSRGLDRKEAAICCKMLEAEIEPVRVAGEAARRAWFGLTDSEEDPAQRRGEAEESNQPAEPFFDPRGPETIEGQCRAQRAEVDEDYENYAMPDARAMVSCSHGDDKRDQESVALAGDNIEEPVSVESVLCTPAEDPNIRVIHPGPNPYYPGSGRIPPWAERIC